MTKQSREKAFKQMLLGGFLFFLPIAILAMGFKWAFYFTTDLIQPFTNFVTNYLEAPEILADLLVVVVMALTCFVVGWLVTTSGGRWFHSRFDERLAKYAPGYQLVKQIIDQFFGDESKSPFANGEVALVKIFPCDTEVTAIVTSKHPDGRYTVFISTGPNPTSGNIYHVHESQVTLFPDISVTDAMRTIIACGAGSGELFSVRPNS